MVPIRAFESGNKVIVQAQNLQTGRWQELLLECTPDQFMKGILAYDAGKFIQDAFPFLKAEEREFLISGITPAEWTKIFGKEA